ncbi:MAG: hypothetical protein MPJ50_06215 [Pirellulales bacterium]|nr:hypothetical protein [Pirellulales bacterium]
MVSTGRSYAGVLAVLAFLVTLCRGAGSGQTTSNILANSLIALAVFAVVGGLIGWIAERMVIEAFTDQPRGKKRGGTTGML